MGNGMVIDPHHLDGEIAHLREQGIEVSPANLKISDRATITMPYHVLQDGLEEARLSKTGAQFGSTKRGIAYVYGDKYMKKTLRMGAWGTCSIWTTRSASAWRPWWTPRTW